MWDPVPIKDLEVLNRLEATGELRGFVDVEAELYHRGPGISKSGLDFIARSPAHFRHMLESTPEPTQAQVFGTAAHFAILEPERFLERYIAAPDIPDRRTKEGKARWEEFQQEAGSRQALRLADYDAIMRMVDAVNSNTIARNLLTGGLRELSIYWEREAEGQRVLCRSRPDHLRCDGILVDIKTTENASREAFARASANYRYHVQAAMYLEAACRATGLVYDQFIFIAVEKTPPWAVGIYVADQAMVKRGRELFTRDLETYARCKAANHWPAYCDDQIQDLYLPAWAVND